ncbi:MAG: hypothetical protein ACOCUI_01130 [bacterium]
MENENEFANNVTDDFGDDFEGNIPTTEDTVSENDLKELTPDDFMGGTYVKIPDVGESITLTVIKLVDNTNIDQKNKENGKPFKVGLKNKKGTWKRTDIICEEGTFTISSWEVFFKLLGKDGALTKYAKENNNSYKGAVVKITRNYNGQHANMKDADLKGVIASMKDVKPSEVTEEMFNTYKEEVTNAMKENKLYLVELIN